MKKLTGDERKELESAINDAYPKLFDIEQVVKYKLEQDLQAIVGGNNNTEIIFNLITWAESNGRIETLLKALLQGRSENAHFQNIIQKILKSSLYGNTEVFQQDEKIIILLEREWRDKLCLILSKIDLEFVFKVCRMTLEKNKIKDINGNYPELIQLKNLDVVREIFLKKYTSNKKNAPPLIEFAERLAKEDNVEKSVREELNQWVQAVATELNINLPTYFDATSDTQSSSNFESYLLVIVTPMGSNKFRLLAELFPNYREDNSSNSSRILELNQEQQVGEVGVECYYSEIPDKIYDFIAVGKPYFNSEYLTIELFVSFPDLEKSIDVEEIPIGCDERRPIGEQYRLILRSIERIRENNGVYLDRLSKRWQELKKIQKQKSLTKGTIKSRWVQLSCAKQLNWNELVNEWEDKKRIGITIIDGLPETPDEKKKLFLAILRGGLPIAVLTRCRSLPNIEIAQELDKLLTVKSLKELGHFIESVRGIRKQAHGKQDAHNYLGYHIGILCDNPNRIPWSLTSQLVEPGD